MPSCSLWCHCDIFSLAWIYMSYLPIFFHIFLKDMGQMDWHQTTTKCMILATYSISLCDIYKTSIQWGFKHLQYISTFCNVQFCVISTESVSKIFFNCIKWFNYMAYSIKLFVIFMTWCKTLASSSVKIWVFCTEQLKYLEPNWKLEAAAKEATLYLFCFWGNFQSADPIYTTIASVIPSLSISSFYLCGLYY